MPDCQPSNFWITQCQIDLSKTKVWFKSDNQNSFFCTCASIEIYSLLKDLFKAQWSNSPSYTFYKENFPKSLWITDHVSLLYLRSYIKSKRWYKLQNFKEISSTPWIKEYITGQGTCHQLETSQNQTEKNSITSNRNTEPTGKSVGIHLSGFIT